VPGYEAPVYIAWATRNRSPLIRIPAARGAATRVELRSPDPSTNPYLALACMLAAGLDGIRRGLVPPAPTERNIFAMSPAERDAAGIGSLPGSLLEAVEAMKGSDLVRKTLGDAMMEKYLSAKTREYMDYTTRVHGWEIDSYLGVY